MEQPTNYRQFFQEAQRFASQPPEAVWEGVRRGLKRKDFWRVKGKLLCTGVALAVGVLVVWGTADRLPSGEAPSMEMPERAAVPAISAPVAEQKLPVTEGKAVCRVPEAGAASRVSAPDCPESGESMAESIRQLLEEAPPQTVMQNEKQAHAHMDTVKTSCSPLASAEKRTSSVTAVEPLSAPVTAAPEFRISFPSAFTPNGDGLNDTYRPLLSENVSQYVFRIYNRQQQLVFQTVHPEEGWDGTYRGVPQPHGAYVCVLSYLSKEGEKRSAKAEFLLLRD